MKTIDITPAEWEIMRVLWANGESRSADLVKIFQKKRNWRPTTTKTLLSRLVAKYCVETLQEGNRYRYRPLVTEQEVWNSATHELFHFICDKERGTKIAELIESWPLSGEDLLKIQQSLAKATKNSVAEVACQCFKGQCRCNLQH